jgi:hypothetical protein
MIFLLVGFGFWYIQWTVIALGPECAISLIIESTKTSSRSKS